MHLVLNKYHTCHRDIYDEDIVLRDITLYSAVADHDTQS